MQMQMKKEILKGNIVKINLEGKWNNYERLVCYNNVLFNSIFNIVHKKNSYILINEIKSGGVIYSWEGEATKIFEIFKKSNSNKTIEDIFYQNSEQGNLVKIGFVIEKSQKTGFEL